MRLVKKLLAGLVLALCASLPVYAEDVPVFDATQESETDAAAIDTSSSTQETASTTSTKSLDERVADLERKLANRSQVDLLAQIQKLEQQVQELRGQLEVQSHDLQVVQDQQRTQYQDLDKRLAKKTSDKIVTTEDKDADTTVAVNTQKKSDTATDADSSNDEASNNDDTASQAQKQQQAYQVGYNFLKQRKYDKAKKSFQNFLKTYPKGTAAVNAHYWLGEIALLQSHPDEAISEFTKVVKNNPDKVKLAEAMLKIGFAYYDKNQLSQARDQLNKVKKQFPGSSAAQLAATRLKEMGG